MRGGHLNKELNDIKVLSYFL